MFTTFDIEEGAPDDFYDTLFDSNKQEIPGIGVAEVVDYERRYDSDGDPENVLVFKIEDRYFRKTGYHDSWGGYGDWDGRLTEVKPVEKTVTFYEPI